MIYQSTDRPPPADRAGSDGVDVCHIATTDPEECVARVGARGINVRHNQMSSGRYGADIESVRLAKLQFSQTAYATAITSQGAPPRNAYALALPLSSTTGCFLNHRPLQPGEIGVVHPNHEFLLVRPPGFRCMVVFPDADLIEQHVRAMYGRSMAEMCRGEPLRSDEGAVAACARHLAQICDEAVLDQAPLREWVAACGGPQRFVSEIVEDVASIVLAPTPVRGWSDRRRLVNRAWEIVEGDRHGLVTVSELCARLAVPIRTLDDAFRACLGMAPKRIILGVRLNKARRQLNHPDERTTVTAVATRFGFFHFGHFSDQYARLFGELPSQTLHRAAKGVSSIAGNRVSASSG